MNNIVFGPVNSRRFGKSLGVDLSPNIKQCNFDCLYCELKSQKTLKEYKDIVSVKTIIKEIKDALEKYKDIDFLTITANGEPTLYPYLNELIQDINKFKGDIKTLILTNSSTINKKEIQDTLLKFDVVKLSLDCVTNRCFKKLDRNHNSINLEEIKKGMLSFKKRFKGVLKIEILFVEGINDKVDEIKELNKFLLKLKPNSIDLSTIDRPPAFDVKAISYDKMYRILNCFDKSLNVNIVSKNRDIQDKLDFSKDEIINILKRRPLNKEDIDILFTSSAKNDLQDLIKNDIVRNIKKNDNIFFILKK